MVAAATSRGLRFEPDVGKAVAGADWIVSAVTADRSLEAAESAQGYIAPGQLFADINSVSPGRKRQSADRVTSRGADYLDMAVMVETLLAAATAGCFDRVVDSLAATYPGLGWPDNARYMFERTLHHGLRRAAEMRESAVTYDELGFVGALADKVADVQERMGLVPATDLPAGPLEEAVVEIAKLRHSLRNRSTDSDD